MRVPDKQLQNSAPDKARQWLRAPKHDYYNVCFSNELRRRAVCINSQMCTAAIAYLRQSSALIGLQTHFRQCGLLATRKCRYIEARD